MTLDAGPPPTTVPRLKLGSSGRRLFGLLRPVRGRVIAIIALTAFSVVLTVLGPLALGRATDAVFDGVLGRMLPGDVSKAQAVEGLRASGQGGLADVVAGSGAVPGQGIDFDRLGLILLVVVGLYAGAALIQLAMGLVLNRAIHAVIRDMREQVERKIQRVPVAVSDAYPRGDLLSRVTNDIDNITVSLTQSLSTLVTSGLTAIGVLGIMLYLSPLLTLAVLVTLPLSILLTKRLMKRAQPLFMGQMQKTGLLNAQVEESITGHEVLSSYGRAEEELDSFRRANDDLAKDSYRAQFISGLVSPLMGFVGNLGYVLICVIGGLRVASGSMTVGEVQAFIQYGRQFSQPISQLASLLNELQSGIASAERVFEFLDADEEDWGVATRARTIGNVELENVSFGYGPDTHEIQDVSLSATPGQTVAIVGPTGAGKTTLVNLLLRFYEPTSGRITLDGQDITQNSRHDLRSRIGMVLQDSWLFEGTIRENIAFGRDGATDAEVEQAARDAHVDRFAQALPDGLDTHLDEDGGNLSAGERQLVTIARVLVSRPDILVLDEATSSVDTRTEMLLQSALTRLRHERTSFVIAHRLSTIKDADLVVVMEDGRVVEQGGHDELLAARGAFFRLHQAQFAGATADAVAP